MEGRATNEDENQDEAPQISNGSGRRFHSSTQQAYNGFGIALLWFLVLMLSSSSRCIRYYLRMGSLEYGILWCRWIQDLDILPCAA
jgi:hypothetical protein